MVVTMDELEAAGLARAAHGSPTTGGPGSWWSRRRAGGSPRPGQRIVDGVHGAVLEALPAAEREVFVSALSRLAASHLATPAESERRCAAVARPTRNGRPAARRLDFKRLSITEPSVTVLPGTGT